MTNMGGELGGRVLGPGDLLGHRYVIRRLIGRGGWGEVFEAEQVDLKRLVAIKTLLDHGDPRYLERFRREARATARLRHPNVVEIIEVDFESDRQPFMVMERLEGEPLAQRLLRGPPLAPDLIIALIKQILSALGAAHAAGIIHRDLKPGNIFLVGDGTTAKVLDFGIAKVEDAGAMTTTGAILGTPIYMAPEQLLLDPIDARTDIYAVGLCLAEMITGRRMVGDARGPELVAQILSETKREAKTGVAEFDQIIARACSRFPKDRYSSTEEMSSAIDRAAPFLRASARTIVGFPTLTIESAPPVAQSRARESRAPSATPAASRQSAPATPRKKRRMSRAALFAFAAFIPLFAGGIGVAALALSGGLHAQKDVAKEASSSPSLPSAPSASSSASDAGAPEDPPPLVIAAPPDDASLPSKASIAKPPPSPKDGCVCRTTDNRKDDLCPQVLAPGYCVCRSPKDTLRLCRVRFSHEFRNNPYCDSEFYNDKAPHSACRGFIRPSMVDDKDLEVDGVVECSFCYDVPRTRAIPKSECQGYDTNGKHQRGTWDCH